MNGPDKLRVSVGLAAINLRTDFVKSLLKQFA
jgi:transcription-repair coupling factor (superfamily II helicase)